VKFGVTHRLLTSALALFGVLAVVSSGSLSRASSAVLLLAVVGAICVPESWQQAPAARYVAATLSVSLLAIAILRLLGGAPVLEVSVEFAAALLITRLATRRGASHDQQVIVLSLLHLVAGTVLGGGLAYGACLFGFLVLAPGALVLSHLRREVEGNYRQGARDRTGLPVDVPRILRSRRVIGPGFLAMTALLSVPILVFTALLFLLFPRVGLSLLIFQSHDHGRITGFSDTVDLGGVGAIRSDPAIVIRFRPATLPTPPPAKMILRLRGTAFDDYRGGGQWSRSMQDRVPLPRSAGEVPILRYADETSDTQLLVELEPLEPTVLFMPPRAVALRWSRDAELGGQRPPSISRGAEETIRYEGGAERVLRYSVFVAPPGESIDEPLTARDRQRYLELPSDTPERLRALALKWTAGAGDDLTKATRIAEHLETEYAYTLDAPSGGKPNPIDHFLFESRAGHCEFFSTAMALLLREVGVPTRNVSGFVGGTYNRFGGFYAVRQGDAHSWVEGYIEGGGHHGWMTFDPTPSSGAQPIADQGGGWSLVRDVYDAVAQGWNRYVVNYDLPTQVGVFQRLQRALHGSSMPTSSVSLTAPRGSLRKVAPWVVGFGAAIVIGARMARRWLSRRGADPTEVARARRQKLATNLWQQVEDALLAHGISRPRNVPPLRFTEQLQAQRRDQIGEIAHRLAARYVLARFGEQPLDADEQRAFASELTRLRKLDLRASIAEP
jgi:transglutaminase-like putative cysteine protease